MIPIYRYASSYRPYSAAGRCRLLQVTTSAVADSPPASVSKPAPTSMRDTSYAPQTSVDSVTLAESLGLRQARLLVNVSEFHRVLSGRCGDRNAPTNFARSALVAQSSLRGSMEGQVIVPQSVTIPAGSISATFTTTPAPETLASRWVFIQGHYRNIRRITGANPRDRLRPATVACDRSRQSGSNWRQFRSRERCAG